MAPSSSFLSSQRPQGNVMHFPRDGASTSTHSTNQPGALPGRRERRHRTHQGLRFGGFLSVMSGTPRVLLYSMADAYSSTMNGSSLLREALLK